jgi:hypothetical protein
MDGHGHDGMRLTNKAGFLGVIVTDVQVYRRIGNLAGLSRFSKYGEPDSGLSTVDSD